jgi:hypothetical protein
LEQFELDFIYQVKDVGPPKRVLGARKGKYAIDGQDYWFILAEAYISKVIPFIEDRFGKLDTFFAWSRLDTPAPTNFHPEVDTTKLLDDDGTS